MSPLVTQSHGPADAHRMVADLIETWTGEPVDTFAVEITFRFEPGSPDERDQLLRDLEDVQRELADAEDRLMGYERERRG